MKPIILFLIMLFTYLLINHFYYVHEGLANAESPTPSTQMYVNENNIKNTTGQFKKMEKEINDQLNSFMKHLKKSQAQSIKNGQN